MDMENLKNEWRDAGEVPTNNTDFKEWQNNITTGKRKTSLMRLAERYKRFHYIGLFMAFISLFWISNPLLMGNHIVITTIYMVIYFLLCSSIDWYLWKKVCDIDVQIMPTMEIIKRAHDCRKLHLQSIMVLLPLAFGLIALFIWNADGDTYFIFGLGAGALIGLCVGLFQLMEFLRDYKTLS